MQHWTCLESDERPKFDLRNFSKAFPIQLLIEQYSCQKTKKVIVVADQISPSLKSPKQVDQGLKAVLKQIAEIRERKTLEILPVKNRKSQ